jgi:hypothetical protein
LCDPFTNVPGAIPHGNPAALCLSKELHGLPVGKNHVLEIDSNCTRFLLDNAAKCVHILICNPPAYAQRHAAILSDNPVDSPIHFEATFIPASNVPSKSPAILKLLKIFELQEIARREST